MVAPDPAVRSEPVTRVVEGVDRGRCPPTRAMFDPASAPGVGLIHAAREMCVVVSLVNRADTGRASTTGPPAGHARRASCQSRHARRRTAASREETGREDEVVERGRPTRSSLCARSHAQVGRVRDIGRRHRLELERSSNDEEAAVRRRHQLDSRQEVVQEDDVGVDESSAAVPSRRRRPARTPSRASASRARSAARRGACSTPSSLATAPRCRPRRRRGRPATSAPSAAQLRTALRWISAIRPTNGFGIVNSVSTR